MLIDRLLSGSVTRVTIRLAGLTAERKAEIVADTINKHGSELLNAFSVVTWEPSAYATRLIENNIKENTPFLSGENIQCDSHPN